MNIITKRFLAFLSILLLTLFSHTAWASESPPQPNSFHLTGQVKFSTVEGGFYGIIGDDGKKYQPTNLPRKLKKDGLAIKFDAKRKDVISAFQWGTIVELSNVAPITTTISNDERKAIYLLLKRLDAFNTKDLSKLQEIDTVSRKLTKEQFDSWVNKYNNFTLQYVDISYADSTTITGSCYYTRELTNGMTLNGNTDLTAMTFTLSLTPKGWNLTQSGPLTAPANFYNTDALADLKQKALAKYNSDNLSSLF
jgi:DNA-directed RNA polymerase subunit H (RpoH/RPB5)